MNLKKWLIASLLTGSSFYLKADNTNQPVLNITSDSVAVTNVAQTRLYSLQYKTNLLDSFWTEEQNKRGTKSNLVFNINNVEPAKFYKVVNNYEPLEPNHQQVGWSSGQHQGIIDCSYDLEVFNYETNNIDVAVTYENSFSIGLVYINTPFNQTLTNGLNHILFHLQLNPSSGTVFTFGDITVTRNEE